MRSDLPSLYGKVEFAVDWMQGIGKGPIPRLSLELVEMSFSFFMWVMGEGSRGVCFVGRGRIRVFERSVRHPTGGIREASGYVRLESEG